MANEGEGNDASYHTSFPLMTTAAGSGTAADPWSQGTGLQSETDFNCSHVTEQPQWEEDPVGVNAPQTHQHYEERSASIHGGKRRWRSFVDNTTGSTYYYDETTGESQWERPMDMHDEYDVADNWREDQGAAENTELENDKVVETGVLDTACESLPERCQSIDGSGGEESASNRVMFSSGGEYLAPGELRRSSSREHGSMGAEEQPASHKSPTGAFTASRAPILEDGKFAKDFVPEDEPAMLDRLTRRDHLSYDRELNGGFIDGRANEVNEKILNSVSEELEQLRVPQEESCLRDSVAARDELKFTSDSDAELVEVSGFSLETTGELITENGEANWSLQRSLNSRDRDQATGIALGASLLRVDSSSTLSTYGGGLDSLARYVAGHSSNLARSAFVELSIPTQDQECATRGDDEVQIVHPRNEGSLPHTPYHNRSSTVADSASESGDAPWNPLESMGNDVGNSAAPSTTQQLSCESTVDEVKQQPDESTNFTRDASALCSSPQVYSERHSWLGSLACEDANPGNRVAMTPATQVQDEVSQSLPPSSETVLTYEQPPTPLAEDHASVAFNFRKAVNQSSSGSCPFAEEIGVESDGAVVHVERRNVDTPQKGAPPCALTENALERDSRSDADSDSRIQRMLGGQQFVDSPLVLIPTAGLSSVEVDRDGVSKAPTSDFIPAAVKLIETGESRIPLLSARKAPAAQSSASILDSGTSDTTVFQRVQTEALPTSRQEVATVTLQAKMRSWAARRRFARQVKHRVIRRREEFEATRLAAVAIQASVRGYIVRQRIKKPTEDHSSPDGKLECDAAGDPSSEKRKQDPIVPGDEGDIHVVDALSASKVLICHHQPHTLEMPVADCFDRGEASVLQMSKFLRPQTINIEKQTVGYSSENIGQQVAADKIKIGSTRKLSSNTFIHEMTRKQDSREFRERRWKDSREMDTYARELRGSSLPREVSISEEDQQGSSSSRGQLPAGQSWSGVEPNHETSSGNQDGREIHEQRDEDSPEMDAYTTALRGPSLPREGSISEKDQQGSRSSRGKLSDGQLWSGEEPTHETSSGKQDSREFDEQRGEDSPEMDAYARELRAPSLPREGSISEEDQQGSSRSRGQLADGQSWSEERPTHEISSGKQDSREFDEQRGEDSPEMGTYAAAPRGPSLPMEVSISEEDHQGNSSSRGKLSGRRSWSGVEPNHEISSGKQDSREFHEQRGEDSPEMGTYATAPRGPSFPREVSISEEDQQGSNRSRGKLSNRQSWSGEEPNHEILSGKEDSREFHKQRGEDSPEIDTYARAQRGPSLPREVPISEEDQQGSSSSRGKLSDRQSWSGEEPTHEISSGKQESREFHEQRRKDSREMDTYARARRRPSLPREVPISEEDQQRSSSSRDKLSHRQSWSGEEANYEALSGKRDSRKFHEQRRKDSREMDAYTRAQRGPSSPREVPISEEDQQGSSRSRGKLSDRQSWSGEEANHKTSSGKQDSREFHKQQGEDTREIVTYARAQRGPSLPTEVSISEENQQGSSSSRGQSSDGQSWSGEEANYEALSGNQSSKEFHEQRRKDSREMDAYARELRKPSLPREGSISEEDQQGISSSRGQFFYRQSWSGKDPTHEISSGKQDSREFHEQRGEDSREMDTYTRPQRGPSFPGKVSISEENQQGNSSSRGKLSDRQSWSSKEPSDTTTSLHRPLRANDRDEFKGLEDSSDDFTFELEGDDGKGGVSSQPGEHNERQKDLCDLIDSKITEERPHLHLARVSSDDNILREPSSQGSGGGTESDAPSKDCGVKRYSRRPISTSRLTTDDHSQESTRVCRSSREKDVNAGTTAQGEVLETLRCVVDKQARSIAKLASTAPGTEASRCEVMRIRELAARQDQVAKDFLSTMESPIVSDSDADCALDHLGQSVGLMVWAVGVFEEIITHAIRSRVAPDPYVVGRVAGDIQRLTRLQERLVYQGIQRFDASARVAEFGNVDPDGDIADVAGVSKGGDQDGKVAVGAPQEWIARLTVDLMYKLRGKVDPRSVSSAHVDATRRECQVTRLANELRCIAASRARASTIITEAGPEFVAKASTAEPSRRNVIPLYGHRQTCEGKQILGKTPVIEDELSTVKKKNVSAADRVAITTAAEKEEIAAAKRILAFLRRRPRNKPATGSGAETASVDSTGVRIDAPSRSAKADAYMCDQGSGRFDAAIDTLHEVVDFVFRRNPSSGSKTLSTKFTPSSSSHEHRPEYRKCSEASREISDDTAKVRGRSKINNDNDETSDTIVSDSINEAPQSSGVEFPPVPLRARASPLYTLPASLVIRGGGSGNHYTTCSDKTKIDRVTELNRDVATRLSSVRSVFGLRASDVLAAFAPPLTSTSTAVPVPRLHISTPPATGGCDSPPRTPSNDALRQRLNAEAKDAFSAGVGQPLGSTRRLYLPVDHRPRLGLRRKIQPRRFDVQWDREQNSVRRIDTWGPVTALGRRLLVKRAQALTEARKQQMLGVVDALRVRQAGRQLRSGAAANALDAVLHALDARDSKSQEERLPVTHMEQLLGLVGRFAFSDSQLCDLRETVSPPSLRERTSDRATSQSSRCQLCQELSTNLRGGNPVGRVHPSCPEDNNSFCCRCRNSMRPQLSPNAGHDKGKLQKTPTNHATLAEESMCCGDHVSIKPNVTVHKTSPTTVSLFRPENAKGVSHVTSIAKLQDDFDAKSGIPREGYQFKTLATERVVAAAVAATSCQSEMRSKRLPRKAETVVGEFSRYLHEVDKYPLDLPRLCRFAQFLTENGLFREAFEVVFHIISSSTAEEGGTYSSAVDAFPVQAPIFLPPGLEGQLLLIASRLAIAVGRYSDAARYAKAAIHRVTVYNIHDSSALLVASSRIFEKMSDDRSAEIILLGCLLQNPHCLPALSLYGRLAARNGEPGNAERYLKRAISLSIDAAKEGVAGREERASDWIALMDLMSDMNPALTRSADAVSYFRKGLACLNWRHPGQAPVTQQSVASSGAAISAASRITSSLIALGRFELLHNRSAERASAYFKACIEQSPWHASAKIHLACCLLEQHGPSSKRMFARIDALLGSVLQFKTHDISVTTASETSSPAQSHRVHSTVPAISRLGKLNPSSSHRAVWLLWAFYAKFAERCLGDPKLALYALDRASEAIAGSRYFGRQINPKRSEGRVLVARAQLCQRWPKLVDTDQLEGSTEGRTALESMFVDATERFPLDPAGYTALGYFLLSHDGGSSSIDLVNRATIAFKTALNIPGCCNSYVPAVRGLAVVSRRLSLLQSVERRALSETEQLDTRVHKEESHYGGSIHGDILFRELDAIDSRRRDNVALLRTAAMHLYTWRLTADPHSSFPSLDSTDSKGMITMENRSLGESQAEALLEKAVDLEPFHVPTLAVLSFVFLQRGAVARAERMLERAIKCSGQRVPRDVIRAMARIRASQGQRSAAISLLRRAIATSTDDNQLWNTDDQSTGDFRGDPLSLCRLGQQLSASNLHAPPLSPTSPAYGSRASAASVRTGPETEPKSVSIVTPPATLSKAPNNEDKADAVRLFAQALVAAGGCSPFKNPLLEEGAGKVTRPTSDANGIVETRARDHQGGSAMPEILAEVHLILSGCDIKGDRGDTVVSQHRIGLIINESQWWHLQEAAKAGPDTKVGLTARYTLGQHALAAGDDRKAEVLFLEALDAEPTTYGACAAFMAVLRQVSVDNASEKMRLRRLRRRQRFNKGKLGTRGNVTNNERATTTRFSQRLEQAQRSVKLLERLEVYASLRKRYMGDRLRGAGLTCPEWALALDEGWETRYATVMEGGDGWAAMHCLS